MATPRIKPSREPILEFETETRDYNIEYYLTKFVDCLPQTIMITVGFNGENDTHNFTKGQILRLQTDARQKCAVAKAAYEGESRLFSIPLCYQTGLRVLDRNGRVAGREQSLYDLVEIHSLPFTAQFAEERRKVTRPRRGKPDRIKRITANDIRRVEIIKVYDEVCLLGNFLINGKPNPDVADIPLYLSKIRVAIVTGIKGRTKDEYAAFMADVDSECECIEYDLQFGTADITLYNGVILQSDSLYTPMGPVLYSNTTVSCDDTDDGIYEEISQPVDAVLSTAQFKTELLTATQKRKPATLPKPPVVQKPGKYLQRPKQPLPGIHPRSPAPPTKLDKPADKTINKNIYANMLPKGTVSPMTKEKIPTQTLKEEIPESTTNSNVSIKNKQSVSDSKLVLDGNDVAKLSINELGEYLTKLKLEKYKEAFRDQLVDGNMLVELDKDILKDEFGFTGLEALRLIKFAKDGHLPT